MDELQSHVDDAIFVDAVQNTIPVPTKTWKLPSPDEIDAYVNKITSQSPTALELEGICFNCLGFYLVSDHISHIAHISYFFLLVLYFCLFSSHLI
jgi:hypothetical protein